MLAEEHRSPIAFGFEITLIVLGVGAVLAWLGALLYVLFFD